MKTRLKASRHRSGLLVEVFDYRGGVSWIHHRGSLPFEASALEVANAGRDSETSQISTTLNIRAVSPKKKITDLGPSLSQSVAITVNDVEKDECG